MKFGLLLLVAALAGCTTKANPASCADDHCNDPSRPFCDEDGSIGGEPDTCIAVECTAGEFETCRGDNALMCNATGNNYDVLVCSDGCSDAAGGCNECASTGTNCGGPSRATHIVAKYLPEICDNFSLNTTLTLSSNLTLDTSNDADCAAGVLTQEGGPGICLIRHKSILVPRDFTLRATGSRVLALLTDDALTIDGTVDVSGDIFSTAVANGPGGGMRTGGFGNPSTGAGAGGGGFKTAGAAGGSPTVDGGAGNGGAISTDPAALDVMIGGAAGGGGSPGGGGGGLMLISCRGTVSVLGTIDLGGGGGGAGFSLLPFAPASGGGSGGHLSIQGMAVIVTGDVFANGGGGGSGQWGTDGSQAGMNGADGSRSATVQAAGAPSVNGSGGGGAGGVGTIAPGVGRAPTSTVGSPSAGAGGGSVGFLQTYTPANVLPTLTPRFVSPAFQPNRSVEVR